MAKGDQRGPKGDRRGPQDPREERVFTEGKELVGHHVSAVVCVVWGKSRDFPCPALEPCSCPVSFASDAVVSTRAGWGLIRGTLLLPSDAWLGVVLQDT